VGLGAPRNTPTAVIEKLNKEVNAGLADSTIRARIAAMGYAAFVSSPVEFAQLIAAETEKWGKVIRAANIKVE
jgi:tripartite-type tricarboxylate transporter receptor subunit TctC